LAQKKSPARPAQKPRTKSGAAANEKPAGKTGAAGRGKKDGVLAGLMTKAFGGKPPASAQESIPYLQMHKDGICRVTKTQYSKTIEFSDINYQLAQRDAQTEIFTQWSSFLNYFDSTVSLQLCFVNKFENIVDFQKAISIPDRNDEFDPTRREFANVLKDQLAKGNNGLKKAKYATFCIESDKPRDVRQRLERIELDVLGNFKQMDVKATALSGIERLEVMHGQFHPFGDTRFKFKWSDIPNSGMSTKDSIAPTSFDFRDKRTFRMGNCYCAASFIQVTEGDLSDQLLRDLLDLDSAVMVTMHIKAIDQTKAIKNIRRTMTDIQRMTIDEQKKAVRAGYDYENIPNDLNTYGTEIKALLTSLQSRNERMFMTTITVINIADTKQKLENYVLSTSGIAQKYDCALKRLDYQQEQALMGSLPLGVNRLDNKRGLTTTSVAIFVPFTTQELFQTGEALYYGRNALSNNLIMASRKTLNNPNGLILGQPGSGKSFAAKREISNAFLVTDDDIIIADPEAEYFPLVEHLNGQVIKLSLSSKHHINPMDINLNYSDDAKPLALKSDFILSLCELIAGGKDGLGPGERTMIDRCLPFVYDKYFNDPKPENMPILQDLYETLLKQNDPDADYVAKALEIYVNGTLNVFNHQTNVDITNRLVCYDIKDLGKALKEIGMLILQDQIWGRVTQNRAEHKATWYYCDEFHLLLRDKQTAEYCVEIWKRFRKWGGIPTALTQNIKDLLASAEIENIFENSDFILMLSQAPGDREILASRLGISEHQLSYVSQSNPGEGLVFFGKTIIPFIDNFPKDTELYRIMTTKPLEMITA
jgi:type IV secretory pathway VirB4 component